MVEAKERTNLTLNTELKAKSKEIYKKLGITLSEAVNMFLEQTVLNKGLPFETKVPNKEIQKAIKEAREGINVEKISLDDLVKEANK